jgi:hypothetical protein
VVSSPPGSLVQRVWWFVALGLAAALLLPGRAEARYLPQDDTPPIVTYSIDGTPGNNGWYVGSTSGPFIVVHWSVSDPESPILSTTGCEPAIQVPDPSTTTTLICSATSDGGTTTVTTKQLKVDATPPTSVTPSASRSPDHNGWYDGAVGISWSGSDATSGIDSCTSMTYTGPDSATANANGTCTDKAGNISAATGFGFKYDDTAPSVSGSASRVPDHNGWYNQALGISWSGSDATSGIDPASCTSLSYTGPDSATASASGTCSDKAGNVSASASFGPFKYDDTAPSVTAAAARGPDNNGWYNAPVGISWSGTDATSGIDACTAPLTYSGPDTKNASSAGSCTDKAGNTGTPAQFSIKYDATPPVATAAPDRGTDANGWYNHGLTISWSSSDPVSGIASCSSTTYSGPDNAGVGRSGTCTDGAGNTSAPVSFGFRFDSTPPTGVAPGPARPPDHDGWYNRPFGVKWSGSDALSGIASCTSSTYGGPTNGATALNGSCTDQAGNTSAAVGYAFKYDSTPPAFDRLAVTPRDDSVALRWRTSGAAEFKVTRNPGVGSAASSVVYEGPASAFADRKVDNYVRYTYVVTAEDAAGNVITRSGSAMPIPVLYAPRPGARVSPGSSPLLAWRSAQTARYYNVQLWLGGHVLGSWWPTASRLKLPARWRFGGSGHTLAPGSYTWYVWPGRGARRLGKYGRLLGKSTFVVGSG